MGRECTELEKQATRKFEGKSKYSPIHFSGAKRICSGEHSLINPTTTRINSLACSLEMVVEYASLQTHEQETLSPTSRFWQQK